MIITPPKLTSSNLATGVIASSGTLGQIIPPSVVLVLLGSVLNISVGNLFTSALLPGITLNGSVGTSTQEIEKIFDKDHGVWNLGVNVAAPLFNGGRLRSISKIQESNYETAKQELVKGILNAFSEIEQLLEQNQSLSIQNNALEVALKQSKDAYELSKERYDKGVTTLESVLNSQRQYNSIQSQYLTIRKYSIENRLSLILAMGGDFEFDVAE